MEPTLAAIILAAGRSTRFRSARSKLLHPLAGRPLIHWTLATVRQLGAEPTIVVIGPDDQALRETCGAGVTFACQTDPRGTGHATLAARDVLAGFSGNVVILYGDVPLLRAESLQRLVRHHLAAGAHLTLMTATVADPRGWGRIVRDNGAVAAIVEDRDAKGGQRDIAEVNVGLYCVAASVLFSLLERVTPDNAQGELYLTDIVAQAVRSGLRLADVPVDVEEVAQVNSRAELAAMEKLVRSGINQACMEAGVTLEDPDSTYIGPDVRIGRDTVIGPNVHLRGRTIIGEGCRIDGSAFLSDSVVGDGVHVKFAVVMTEAEVGSGCQIGPFAQLRPGSRLAPEVHIGNFVETKKAVIGARTKANHLAYIGDADVGSDANIGAGTITCNYDGFAKHRTVIGNRVQVGSDSQLVAPVTLADDCYVATGTTVRQDVPAGALVFNTRDQAVREGWVAEFRRRHSGDDTKLTSRTPPRARLRVVATPKTAAKSRRKKRPPAGTRKAARARATRLKRRRGR